MKMTLNAKAKNLRYFLYFVLISFLILDTVFSLYQYYSENLDGDIVESVLPIPSMKKTMNDPLGIKTIIEKDYHHNPNRFFSHWTFQKFFRNVPIILQNFLSPIDSVYASCGIAKLIMHILLVMLLYVSICGNFKIFSRNFLVTATILVPLFQTNGFVRKIGIIDPSITYSFFYAFPAILLIIYFLPFIFEFFHKKKFRIPLVIKLLWIPLALIASLSGPLNPGIALIVSMMVIIKNLLDNYSQNKDERVLKRLFLSIKKIPKNYYFYLIPISVFSLYSIYVGKYNSAQFWEPLPLKELFLKLPKGIGEYIQCILMFFGVIFILNIVLICLKYKNTEGGKSILKAFKWVAIFFIIYVILLPFGGYRSYRPNIIRYDTILPITLMLLFLIGKSSLFLINYISPKIKKWYCLVLVLFIIFFTVADKQNFSRNDCERNSLKIIAESHEEIVAIPNNCTIASWGLTNNPEMSKHVGEMLYMWQITDKPKLFYNKKE